jgi:hypothetical protein
MSSLLWAQLLDALHQRRVVREQSAGGQSREQVDVVEHSVRAVQYGCMGSHARMNTEVRAPTRNEVGL